MPIMPARLGGNPAAVTLRPWRRRALEKEEAVDRRAGNTATDLPRREEEEEARWREEEDEEEKELGAAAAAEARAGMEAKMVMVAMEDAFGSGGICF